MKNGNGAMKNGENMKKRNETMKTMAIMKAAAAMAEI